MAKTREYMDYLDDEIGIAPANSQEEFQAAETIVEIMKDHGLEPTIQEFDARPLSRTMPQILQLVMFVGMLLSGVGPGVVRAIGLVLVVACAVLLLVIHSGRSVFGAMGPKVRSQNVIGVHRATGSQVTKGSRPIVIMAHYDTPHESPLFTRLARNQSLLRQASVPCVVVVLVAAILQVMAFIPAGLRIVVWILGLVVALPLVVLSVCELMGRFSACTVGANDNKSSVAALLSVLDEVRPSDDRASVGRSDEYDGTSSDEVGAEEAQAGPTQTTYGVRHGKAVLEQLGILPESCEIVYEEGRAPEVKQDETQQVEDMSEDGFEDGYAPEYGPDEVMTGDGGAREQDPWSESESSYEEVSPDTYADEDTSGSSQQGEMAGDSAGDSAYENGTYDAYDQEAWSTDEAYTQDESDYESSYNYEGTDVAPQKTGLSAKLRDAFATLKEHLASRKDKTDIDIPRGNASGNDEDFSEFEETDWGEDDWSEDQYESQEELRPINRDEFSARRNAPSAWNGEPASTPEDSYDTPADDYQADEYAIEDEAYAEDSTYDQDSYDSEDMTGPTEGQDEEAWEETDEVRPEDAPSDMNRTSHDISHEDGPDWSVIDAEAEGESVEVAMPTGLGEEVYDQDDDQQFDDLYDADNEDLADMEEELNEDQLSSSMPLPRTGGDRANADVRNDSSSSDDVSEQRAERGEEQSASDDAHGLSWDDDNAQSPEDSDDVLPKDTRGLDTLSEDYDVYEDDSDEQLDEPEPVDDPTWGQTSYVPPKPKTSVARRATLYDVPNPSEDTRDPLGDVETDEYDTSDGEDVESNNVSASGGSGESRQESNRARNWKGGAAVRADLRDDDDQDSPDWYDATDVEDEAQASGEDVTGETEPSSDDAYEDADESSFVGDGELQDSILRMGDDLLISHDIWFVAVGASSIDHAGAEAFLSNFRQDIRGAFLINLHCIGAGTPTVLTREGLHAGRRADRRLVRLLTNVADDLHVQLEKASYDWDDTDATPAMRARVRAVTIMGRDENGLPALSHTQDDVPENVDGRQVAAIVRVITEAIRRS